MSEDKLRSLSLGNRLLNEPFPWRHADDAGCFASDAEQEQLARIEIGGHPGSNGRDGQSYHQPPATSGRSGRRGGDASLAEHGQPGGTLDVTLSYRRGERQSSHFSIAGTIDPTEKPATELVQEFEIGHAGYVFVSAPGGKGGNGGRGGHGQPGSQGSRGRDATRYSRGGDGGPGGDGGDAGNPSDGADGGRGGRVSLTLGHRDQGLLMLVKGNLAGGELGFAGEPGRGGRGGDGGSGGSSYSWTERESYTDGQGKRQTRTTRHTNPGGSRGRDGRDGADSAYRARDGSPGWLGSLKISVVQADGSHLEYAAPYDLQLATFDIIGEHEVLEPDSLVSLDRIVVRNIGGMPTPENYTVRIFLPSDRWIVSDDVDLVLHRSLQPGEPFTFTDHGLRFRIDDFVVSEPRQRPFTLRHKISPHSMLESGIHRPFRNFENGEEVVVRFPVELTAITYLGSLAPGESTRVIWGITNTSDEVFDHKHLYRAVRTDVEWLGGDLDARHLVFFDDADQSQEIVASPFRKPLLDLQPGETRIIETRIGVKESADVVPYQGFAMGVGVDLQRPSTSDRCDQYRRVDCRKVSIRISERYLRQEGSRFLLIANQKTDLNDIEKWTRLADYFGSSLDVWDISYYGFLDLARAVDRDQTLLQQWRGMTIIVPNNYIQTPIGKTAAFTQLAKSQFLEAAADYDINFYVVGDARTGGEAMLQSALIPVGQAKSTNSLKTQKQFLREIKRWTKYVEQSQDLVGGATGDARMFADVSLGAVHEFEIEKRTLLFQPKANWLEKHARKLQKKLRKSDPLHRWMIVFRNDHGDSDTSWGFFRKRRIGRLEVRRTLDSTKGSVVLYEVDAIDAIDTDFITSKANKHGIFLALKFEDKVDRFIRLVSERTFPRYSENYVDRPLSDAEVQEIGNELVDSILVDLFNEQRVARRSKIWGRFHVAALMPKLNYLAERSLNYAVTYRQMQKNEVSLELLYELLANIRHMARNSKSAWDSAWLPTSFFKRSRAVSAHMLQRTDRIVTSIFGRRLSWWDRVTNASDDYDAFGKSTKKDPQRIERKIADERLQALEDELHRFHRSMEKYGAAQEHPGLTYDPELLAENERVISGQTFDTLVAMEAKAGQMRVDTERAIGAQRSDLLVPLRTVQETPIETSQSTSQS